MTDNMPTTDDVELALGIFLGRPGGRLYDRDRYGSNQLSRMQAAISAVMGRHTDETPDLQAQLVDGGELYQAQLAAQVAARRHAEAATEAVLEQSDLAQRAFATIQTNGAAEQADRERRWEIAQAGHADAHWRDGVFAALTHAEMQKDIDSDATDRERIIEAAGWWTAQLTSKPVVPPAPPSPWAAGFADQLVGRVADMPTVESVKLEDDGTELRVTVVVGRDADDELVREFLYITVHGTPA